MHGFMFQSLRDQRNMKYLKEGGRPAVRKTLRRVMQLLRPYRRQLLWGLLIILAGVGLGLVPPLLIRRLIDVAIPRRNLGMIALLAAGMALFPAAGGLITVGQNYLNTVVAQGVVYDLRQRMFQHGQEMGLDFFTWTRAGEIHSRFINDANSLQMVITQSFMGQISNIFTVILTFVTMTAIDWRLAVLSAVVLPAFALPVLYFGRQRYQAVQKSQDALADMGTRLEETLTLSGAIVVKSFGRQSYEQDRFDRINKRVKTTQIHQALVGQWMMMAVTALSALGPALLYGYGGYLVVMHQLKLGTVVAFAAYLTRLYGPASSLAGANATFLGGLALFDRLFTFLDKTPSVPQPCP
ncbi:MAG: ABC transporter ATP-binding protein, partial [Firmicutes bacterium]|nr:ABC transporter ATP-binding protein [Bacillota bacterium]